ncbi:hypothetical protein V6V47_26655 [Micromonospora sp. CPCC 205539]|uniref:hypothetical protein n=1 Tax=Micromonospora sp. CPCC 205539 TaxID=3122408 RepID=UPI002FF35E73
MSYIAEIFPIAPVDMAVQLAAPAGATYLLTLPARRPGAPRTRAGRLAARRLPTLTVGSS